jgi:hypothetical protein
MTLEGPDGRRYLVYRDGTLVRPEDAPARMEDLTPESRRIIEALLAAKRSADERAASVASRVAIEAADPDHEPGR